MTDMTDFGDLTYEPAPRDFTKRPEAAFAVVCAGSDHRPEHVINIILNNEVARGVCACSFEVIGKPNPVWNTVMCHKSTGSTIFTEPTNA